MQRLLLGVALPLLLCFGSVVMFADGETTTRRTLFEAYQWTKVSISGLSEYDEFVYSYHVPSLAEVDGIMVAVAEARYKHYIVGYAGEIMAKYSTDNGNTWKTIVAIPRKTTNTYARSINPTVVHYKEKLLFFAETFEQWTDDWTNYKSGDGDFVHSLSYNMPYTYGNNEKKAFKFHKPTSLLPELSNEIKRLEIKRLLVGYGRGIEVNGTFIVPVWYINTKKEMRPTILLSGSPNWRLAKGTGDAGSLESAVVEWEGKLIMNARTNDGYRKVYESADMGDTWKEALGSLSRVWGNAPNRQGNGCSASFITVTIENKPVMLFSHPLNTKGGGSRDRLHLWLTDNKRIYDVGQISENGDNTGHSSLLYTNGTLYCLYEKERYGTTYYYSSVLAHLVDELKKIKDVVKKWKNQDKAFSESCDEKDSRASYPGSTCNVHIPQKGLVGFLSGEVIQNKWKDAYSCVDAELTGGVKVTNGIKFNGIGAGAMWPVGKQGQNQRYHFMNHEFTLAALVIVHQCRGKPRIPLISVVLDTKNRANLIEIFCTNAGLLSFRMRKGVWRKILCGFNNQVRILITMKNGITKLFVNQEEMFSTKSSIESGVLSTSISHICILDCQNTKTQTYAHVTIKNVLLYNRVLSKEEIHLLYLPIIPTKTPTISKITTHTNSLSKTLSTTETPSQSLSPTTTQSLSHTLSESQSLSHTASKSQSLSHTVSESHSLSNTLSESQSLSQTASKSQSLSQTVSESQSLSHTASKSQSLSNTLSESHSLSNTLSESQSLSQTVSESQSLSHTASKSQSLSNTVSESQSLSHTASKSQSLSNTVSESQSLSHTASKSQSLSNTLSESQSLSQTASKSHSLSNTLSESQSLSQTASKSQSLSNTVSESQSLSHTASKSQSLSNTLSESQSLSHTASKSQSLSNTLSESQSLSQTASKSHSLSNTLSESQSLSQTASKSQSLSNTLSESQSLSHTASKSQSLSNTVSESQSLSHTASKSQSLSHTVSESQSLSHTASKSQSLSNTVSESQSLSQTVSESQSLSHTASKSHSLSNTLSESQSLSQTASKSQSLSNTLSESQSLSQTVSESHSLSNTLSESQSLSHTASKSHSLSNTLSESQSLSHTASKSQSLSHTASKSHSLSNTLSESQSLSQTVSESQSLSHTASKSQSLSHTASKSQSLSHTASKSQSLSNTVSESQSLSQTVSESQSLSHTASKSQSLSNTLSESQSLSHTSSKSQSLSNTVSESQSLSQTVSESQSLSHTASKSQSLSHTASESHSLSNTLSESQSLSQTVSESQSLSHTASKSQSLSNTVSESQSLSHTASKSQSLSNTVSESQSLSHTASKSQSLSQTVSESQSLSQTVSESQSLSHTASKSQSLSNTVSESQSLSQTVSESQSLSHTVSESQSLIHTYVAIEGGSGKGMKRDASFKREQDLYSDSQPGLLESTQIPLQTSNKVCPSIVVETSPTGDVTQKDIDGSNKGKRMLLVSLPKHFYWPNSYGVGSLIAFSGGSGAHQPNGFSGKWGEMLRGATWRRNTTNPRSVLKAEVPTYSNYIIDSDEEIVISVDAKDLSVDCQGPLRGSFTIHAENTSKIAKTSKVVNSVIAGMTAVTVFGAGGVGSILEIQALSLLSRMNCAPKEERYGFNLLPYFTSIFVHLGSLWIVLGNALIVVIFGFIHYAITVFYKNMRKGDSSKAWSRMYFPSLTYFVAYIMHIGIFVYSVSLLFIIKAEWHYYVVGIAGTSYGLIFPLFVIYYVAHYIEVQFVPYTHFINQSCFKRWISPHGYWTPRNQVKMYGSIFFTLKNKYLYWCVFHLTIVSIAGIVTVIPTSTDNCHIQYFCLMGIFLFGSIVTAVANMMRSLFLTSMHTLSFFLLATLCCIGGLNYVLPNMMFLNAYFLFTVMLLIVVFITLLYNACLLFYDWMYATNDAIESITMKEPFTQGKFKKDLTKGNNLPYGKEDPFVSMQSENVNQIFNEPFGNKM